MDRTLGYLRETLSNYTDDHTEGRHLYEKLTEGQYKSEGAFVRSLNQKEIDFLNKILHAEINYAQDVQDDRRVYELNEVYELLF
ncbi:sigma-G-dependent sporulation-specific acid-soluble spore protein CsgA [Neobacillus mesonae]|uniref:Sporulation protein n=1 Tax=Neobacillus mesonae TaxID=1193713 RepID=A0A3T0I6S1_9BACI|nr:sigma-G-dependent sporulation-specific acid-soluble spore protein CsgA [Neobacillus mesonae]AZU65036.1 sporulation protein [Neobacillus mesonae]MED4203960.1 sigma-G-dependent sporulation-specific acid-soluble spore protein CsgA [Neobacillus mesonae]